MLMPPKTGLVLLMLAIALPLLEIAIMIKVTGSIGVPLTLLAIFATGALGVWVLQGHGFVIMRRMNEALREGGTPLVPMIEGGLLFLAGWLLISPGFICDAVGLALLAPPVRLGVAAAIRGALWPDMEAEGVQPSARRPGESPFARDGAEAERPRPRGPRGPGPVIDGEFERLDEHDMPGADKRNSGGPGRPRAS